MPSGGRRRRGMPVSLRFDFIQNTRRGHLSLAFTGRPLISGGASSFRHSPSSRDELVCLPLPPLHHRKTQRHRIYPVRQWWCPPPTVRLSLPTRQATALGEYILPHYYIQPPPYPPSIAWRYDHLVVVCITELRSRFPSRCGRKTGFSRQFLPFIFIFLTTIQYTGGLLCKL